jgi:opacity protein-like surface antigen
LEIKPNATVAKPFAAFNQLFISSFKGSIMKHIIVTLIGIIMSFSAQAEKADLYLLGGLANTNESYASGSGFYLGLGRSLGNAKKLLGANLPGNVALEGSYASTSNGAYKSTSMAGAGVHTAAVNDKLNWLAIGGIGIFKSEYSTCVIGFCATATASVNSMVLGAGLQYKFSPTLLLEGRYHFSGYDGLRLGAHYKF